VLPFSIALERFEPVARRRAQEVQRFGRMQLGELSLGDPKAGRKTPAPAGFEQGLRILAPEASDHVLMYIVKR